MLKICMCELSALEYEFELAEKNHLSSIAWEVKRAKMGFNGLQHLMDRWKREAGLSE